MPQDDVKVTIDEKKNRITIDMPLEPPRVSKSQKTLVIASTHGNLRSTAKYDGKEVVVGVNAYIPRN